MGIGELTRTVILVCSALVVMRQDGLTHPLMPPVNAAKPPVIVVGFVGGFVAHDNMVHSGVQLAAHLRETHPSGVFVKVFENRRREKAHQEILKILDTDHDGTLSDEEKKKAQWQNDEVIPANVGEAVNFYQSDGLLRGRSKIRAADEKRTRILGNFRFDYKSKNIKCDKYPWFLRVFAKYHTKIECDATVWSQVESLIGSKLPPV